MRYSKDLPPRKMHFIRRATKLFPTPGGPRRKTDSPAKAARIPKRIGSSLWMSPHKEPSMRAGRRFKKGRFGDFIVLV